MSNPHTHHIGKDIIDLLQPSQLEHLSPQILQRAADEIRSLREQVDNLNKYLNEWKDDTMKILKERDEARRELCKWSECSDICTAERAAEMRGWDCFFADRFLAPRTQPENNELPYDKYDGVLPGDIGTDRP